MRKRNVALMLISLAIPMSLFAKVPRIVVSDLTGYTKIDTKFTPIELNGKNMLPMRQVFSSVGYEVEYDEKTKMTRISDRECLNRFDIQADNKTLKLYNTDPNSEAVKWEPNGEKILDVAPTNIKGTLYVPVRLVEIFGDTVDFKPERNLITIMAERINSDYIYNENEKITKDKVDLDRLETDSRKELNKGKAVDSAGYVIKVGDLVSRGMFSGQVVKIEDTRVMVDWTYCSPMAGNDMNKWAMLEGIKFGTKQWMSSESLKIDR